MGKKKFEMDAKQLSFIMVSMIVLVILSFILGMQVGRLIKNVENQPGESPSLPVLNKVKISFKNVSGFGNLTGKAKNAAPPVEIKAEVKTSVQAGDGNPEEKRKDPPKEKTDVQTMLKKGGSFYIQVGAFKRAESVAAITGKLKGLGMEYKVVSGNMSRVLVIAYGTENDKKMVLEKLKKEGIQGIVVKR